MNSDVLKMAIIRLGFGSVSILGGILMLYHNQVESALKINSIIGSIGPFVFLLVSFIGIMGIASNMPPQRIAMIVVGIALILLATR